MIRTNNIVVENLKCHGCANTIENGLNEMPGVKNISVDIQSSQVTIDHDDNISIDTYLKKLIQLGYPQTGDPNTLLTKAKSYVSCAIGRMK